MNSLLQREPIAVIGLACRFPGGLDNPDLFWKALVNKFDAISEIPEDRWNTQRFYADNDQAAAKMYIRKGGFLKQDIRTFDATFFGISPREAEFMDPQQRLLLEVAWEAMENAGIDARVYEGQNVGVYIGGFTLDHLLNQLGSTNRANIGAHSAAGSTMTMLANRLSYAFDFRGPSLSIDTACSSSLVAFHYGCQDLWSGRCSMALIGGANTILRPEYGIAMCKGKFLARDGHCKSFDSRGDGYARGEGAGVVLIKTLSKAQADGDPICALVEATGINQDGRTNGITVPNADAQRALTTQVLSQAGIEPALIRYVEAHGTGTTIGDPIECDAIGSVYGRDRKDDGCVIGSVKSNIGHLEAAAGVAGLIKLVLSLHNNQIPPLATLIEPNSTIPFKELGLQLAERLMPMANGSKDVFAAINSFGYGGTNAHAILRQYTEPKTGARPRVADAPAVNRQTQPKLLVLSARSKPALVELAERYRDRIADDRVTFDDLLYSAARRRSHASYRLAIAANGREQLTERLCAFIGGTPDDFVWTGTQPYQGLRRPVFVFTGMGPQWWGMGQELWHDDPVYRATVAKADEIFGAVSGFSILKEMLKNESESRITETQFAQPANLLVQLGLTAMLRAAGVTPGAIVGHSVGEVTASYAAGMLTLEEAITVSYHRSRMQKKAAGTGGMLAVALTVKEAQELLKGREHLVSIGAINGPKTLTFSGDVEELKRIAVAVEATGAFARFLQVEVPYHSPMMDPLKAELAESLAHLAPRPSAVPIYSTVSGERVKDIAYNADYWIRNIREPVFFANAIANLLADGFTSFIEVGPHPVLSSALKECFIGGRSEAVSIETLRRMEPERARVFQAIAQVYTSGCDIDWSRLYEQGQFVQLPNYPWQRELLWNESAVSRSDRTGSLDGPLLGLRKSNAAHSWELDLAAGHLFYLTDHVVDGLPILPAAGYVEAMLEAATLEFPDSGCVTFRNLRLDKALPLRSETLQRLVTTYVPKLKQVDIISFDDNNPAEPTHHARADIYPLDAAAPESVDLKALLELFPQAVDLPQLYAGFARRGLQYGPFFQTIRDLRTSNDCSEVLACLAVAERFDASGFKYLCHPTLFDGCLQALITLLDSDSDALYLPITMKELRLYRELPLTVWCRGTLRERTARKIVCDMQLLDETGAIVAVVQGAEFTALAGGREESAPVPTGNYQYVWKHSEETPSLGRAGRWLIVTDCTNGVGTATADIMRSLDADIASLATFGVANPSTGVDKLRSGDVNGAAALFQRLDRCTGIAFFGSLDALTKSDDPTGEKATAALLTLIQGLLKARLTVLPRLYVVTQCAFKVTDGDRAVQPSQGTMIGFARVAFNEIDGPRCSTIDLGASIDDAMLTNLAVELLRDSLMDDVALRTAGRFCSELQNTESLHEVRWTHSPLADRPFLEIEPGTSDRAPALREGSRQQLGASEVEVYLEAATLPTTALYGSHASPSSSRFTMEFAGVVTAAGGAVDNLAVGSRVCGYAPLSLGSYVRIDPSAFPLVSATSPVASTALAAGLMTHASAVMLASLASISAGDRVLVWADRSGIAVAQAMHRRGAAVSFFGNPEELSLNNRLPDLPSYPRTAEGLHQAFIEQTESMGFTVLVAPLSLWTDRFDCAVLKEGGTTIDTEEDVGRRPIVLEERVGQVLRRDPCILTKLRPDCMADIGRSVLRLMECQEVATVFPPVLSAADLTTLGATQLEGHDHVVLAFDDGKRDVTVIATDRFCCSPEATYLITGGFGGLGRKVACWLVDRGARTLVLVGRRGADDEDKRDFVAKLLRRGVTVLAAAVDVADATQVGDLLDRIAQTLPPIKGIMHTAAVLDDKPIVEMDFRSLTTVMAPKAKGAWVLHTMTEAIPLDFFVLFSSVSALVGNSRQANYCAANAFLDSLAWHRRLRGLPATSLNWGAVVDAGIVTRDERLEQHLKSIGLPAFPVREGFAGMERAILRGITQVCISRPISWAQWAVYETLGGESPRFASLVAAARAERDTSGQAQFSDRLLEFDAFERQEVLASLLASIFAEELRLPEDALALDRPVTSFGVDSLMGLNIQMAIEMFMGLKVPMLELIGKNTLRDLSGKLLHNMGLAPAETALAAE